uniref:Uncharacterized protein n=1 Tax=Anguilla anguilla TaxID=7936 RepID=A0A0E9Y2L4_ANGAN
MHEQQCNRVAVFNVYKHTF